LDNKPLSPLGPLSLSWVAKDDHELIKNTLIKAPWSLIGSGIFPKQFPGFLG
jgi:hypothetical protein